MNRIEVCLAARNWTGLSLGEMLEAGRIDWFDRKTIREWVKLALGEPVHVWQVEQINAVTAQIMMGEMSDEAGFELGSLKPRWADPNESHGGWCEDAPCCGCCGGDFISDAESDWVNEGGWS